MFGERKENTRKWGKGWLRELSWAEQEGAAICVLKATIKARPFTTGVPYARLHSFLTKNLSDFWAINPQFRVNYHSPFSFLVFKFFCSS
jgi:hypothetical protein